MKKLTSCVLFAGAGFVKETTVCAVYNKYQHRTCNRRIKQSGVSQAQQGKVCNSICCNTTASRVVFKSEVDYKLCACFNKVDLIEAMSFVVKSQFIVPDLSEEDDMVDDPPSEDDLN